MIAPGKIAPGQPIRLTSSYVDAATGNPVDPSTVEFELISPSGSKKTFTYLVGSDILKLSVGHYYIDVTPDHGGHWFYRWVSTGSGAGATEGKFNVQASKFEGCDYPGWDYR